MEGGDKDGKEPGLGPVFSPDGLSYAEMAIKLHEYGYISDEEMAPDGGVAAVRRMIYDSIHQDRQRYSKFRTVTDQQIEEKKVAERKRLLMEAGVYANSLGIEVPKSNLGIRSADLGVFGIEVNGMNIVDAELVCEALQSDLFPKETVNEGPALTMMRTIRMIRWIVAGRPLGNETRSNPPDEHQG